MTILYLEIFSIRIINKTIKITIIKIIKKVVFLMACSKLTTHKIKIIIKMN